MVGTEYFERGAPRLVLRTGDRYVAPNEALRLGSWPLSAESGLARKSARTALQIIQGAGCATPLWQSMQVALPSSTGA